MVLFANCAIGEKEAYKESSGEAGKIVISNRIEGHPEEANNRQAVGHWEADTAAGKTVLPVLLPLLFAIMDKLESICQSL